ncbi:MAG TPA: hypothetical protein ENI26_01935 [Methylophaga aminisulfidivorans]|uniref:DUF3277 family protein n=2 Tax=root TaxID=1 RepID=A0A7C2A9W0_9GAMM|nr:hypothetical protein [Methylophaga aminisulfidivorans]
MAINNFSVEQIVVTVNGREITDWGESEQPISEAPIDPKATLRRGKGGGAVRLDRVNPGRALTLSLNPGSPDSAYMQSLFNSNATITYTRQVIGTLEKVIGTEGVIVNDGPVNRGGQTISDDEYMIELNAWTGLKGGE